MDNGTHGIKKMSEISSKIRSIRFALALCLVCSILLTGASVGLKSIQDLNVDIDRQKNILKAVGLIGYDSAFDAVKVQNLYEENIKKIQINPAGKIVAGKEGDEKSDYLQVYIYLKGDDIGSYILPIHTQGLWGKISGYMALDTDGSTVLGFTVYSHSETPGLGGEIEREWFQRNFIGKKIINHKGDFVSVRIAKGSVTDSIPSEQQQNFVDGISGATLTGKLLTSGLKEVLSTYEPMSLKFRTRQQIKLYKR